MSLATLSHSELLEKLQTELGPAIFDDIARHFARGVVIYVSPDLDLITVAQHFIRDAQNQVEAWLQNGQLQRLNDATAKRWHSEQTALQALVVAPWVLAQPVAQPMAQPVTQPD